MEEETALLSSIKPKEIGSYSEDVFPPVGDVGQAPKTESLPLPSRVETKSLRHTQLSPDGTTLLTASVAESQHSSIRSIILPPTLLTSPAPHPLNAYSTLAIPEPVRAITSYPYFDLSTPSTTLLLTSFPEHPIRLHNALSLDSAVVASYPYIRTETEAFLAPHSLLFTPDATHFLAGADSELGVFDVSRYGQGPIERYKLRRNGQIGAANQWRLKRGIISTLDISSEGILAAGTFSREIGLYASNGRGGCVSSFGLSSDASGDWNHAGSGISKVKWSTCGMYLLIGERNSDVIRVFDVRGQHKMLQVLAGRKTETMMRLGWDLTPNGEVWAGGTDGFVRVWEGIGESEGDLEAVMSWKAHEDPVVSTFVHPSGSVVITCSAEDRKSSLLKNSSIPSDNSSDEESEEESDAGSEAFIDSVKSDSNIKIWSL